MFNVADYLKKFAQLRGAALLSNDAVASALKEVCKIEGAKFEAKKGILYLKASPREKMMVFTKKAALLAAIKAKDPLSNISDVR